MRRFSIQTAQAVSGSAATVTNELSLTTGASRACQIYEVICGQAAVVADAQIRLDLYQVTALTPGVAITPVNLDFGNSGAAAITTASSLPTAVTPTGISLLSLWLNSRATVRWAAVDPDSRIIVPGGGGTAGTVVFQNQQPGTVAGLQLGLQTYIAE